MHFSYSVPLTLPRPPWHPIPMPVHHSKAPWTAICPVLLHFLPSILSAVATPIGLLFLPLHWEDSCHHWSQMARILAKTKIKSKFASYATLPQLLTEFSYSLLEALSLFLGYHTDLIFFLCHCHPFLCFICLFQAFQFSPHKCLTSPGLSSAPFSLLSLGKLILCYGFEHHL